MGTVSAVSFGGCLGGGPGGQPTTTDMEAQTRTEASTETTTEATSTQTETTTAESVGQREYPGYDWGMLADAEPQSTTEVTLENTAFHPLIAEVPTGTAISFVNNDSYGHTVTIPALDIDEQLSGGGSIELTFDETGTLDYVCALHPPGMLGRLIVTEETPTETPQPSTETTTTSTPTPTPTDSGTDGGGYGY